MSDHDNLPHDHTEGKTTRVEQIKARLEELRDQQKTTSDMPNLLGATGPEADALRTELLKLTSRPRQEK